MKKTFVSFGLGMVLALAVPGVAVADGPHHVMVSDAACNDGTSAARVISGNKTVPMYMVTAPIGCMTMPGAFQGP
jgi:hypothetical protein